MVDKAKGQYDKDFKTVDNLVAILRNKYHPKFFTSMEEFSQTPYFHTKGRMSIDDYTDGYIDESDSYLIIVFDDYRDFNGGIKGDNYCDDVVLCYDKKTQKIIKYFYTGAENDYLYDIEAFID